MKRLLSLLAVLTLVVALVGGCVQGGQDLSTYLGGNHSHTTIPKLRVGISESNVPLTFRNSKTNQLIGYDIKMVNEVAKRANWEVEFVAIDWSNPFPALDDGTVDCIWNWHDLDNMPSGGVENTNDIMDGRASSGMQSASGETDQTAKYRVISPYVRWGQTMVGMAERGMASFESMPGLRMGVVTGSQAERALLKEPEYVDTLGELIRYDSLEELFVALTSNRVDGITVDETLARYYNFKDSDFTCADIEIKDQQPSAIIFRNDGSGIDELVYACLRQMRDDNFISNLDYEVFNYNINAIQSTEALGGNMAQHGH